ncbi:Hemin uptake protein [Bosea sp. LC85]|nr:Hemin uptake protein [Bosea sp. LC85]
MSSVPPSDISGKTAPLPGQSDVPIVDVRQLVGAGREVILMHLGEAYRLRVTARDRLILTK